MIRSIFRRTAPTAAVPAADVPPPTSAAPISLVRPDEDFEPTHEQLAVAQRVVRDGDEAAYRVLRDGLCGGSSRAAGAVLSIVVRRERAAETLQRVGLG